MLINEAFLTALSQSTKPSTACFCHRIVIKHFNNAILCNPAFSAPRTYPLAALVRNEAHCDQKPKRCKKSNEVATSREYLTLTSGNAARHHVRPLETQPSARFMDLNESDNKLRTPKVNKLFQVHVIRGRAKEKCLEQGQMTHRVKS